MNARVRLDTTSHKVNVGDSITIIPKFTTRGFTSEPFNFTWTIGTLTTNFTESPTMASVVTSNALTDLNQEHIAYEISDISDGEVVWIPLSLTVSNASESASVTMTQSARKGDPLSTSVLVKSIKDGRLVFQEIFEDNIESKLVDQNEGITDANILHHGDISIQDATPDIGEFIDNGSVFDPVGINNNPDSLYKENQLSDLSYEERQILLAGSEIKRVGYNSLGVTAQFNHYQGNRKPINFAGRSNHVVRLIPPARAKRIPADAQPVYMPYPAPPTTQPTCTLCTPTSENTYYETDENQECSIETTVTDITKTTTCE